MVRSARNGECRAEVQAHLHRDRRTRRALHPLRRHVLASNPRDDGAVRGAWAQPPVRRHHVARPVHAAAAGQATRIRGRHHACAPSRRRADGGRAAQLRDAAHQGGWRRRTAQGPRRRARLSGGGADAARGPLGGHDRRRARRRGPSCGARRGHDCARIRQAGHAAGHRDIPLRGAEHLEPHDLQPAVVAPGLRGGRCRACAA